MTGRTWKIGDALTLTVPPSACWDKQTKQSRTPEAAKPEYLGIREEAAEIGTTPILKNRTSHHQKFVKPQQVPVVRPAVSGNVRPAAGWHHHHHQQLLLAAVQRSSPPATSKQAIAILGKRSVRCQGFRTAGSHPIGQVGGRASRDETRREND